MEPFTFKALVTEEVNGEFIQSIKTVSSTNLPDHDVIIQVHYSSLNYKDMLSATGHTGITHLYPFTPGIDAAGTVFKSRDKRFREGDKVIVTSYDLGMNTPGGFGRIISVPGDWIIPLPDNMSLKESMMIGTAPTFSNVGKILISACGNCHTTQQRNGVRVNNYENLMSSVGERYQMEIVIPDSAQISPLIDKIEPDPEFGARMPVGGSPLSDARINQIRTWINNGAKHD